MYLESEREVIKEDKVKLDLFKNELKTRQKTIESLRYEFIIKNNHYGISSGVGDLSAEYRELGYHKIQRSNGGNFPFLIIYRPCILPNKPPSL